MPIVKHNYLVMRAEDIAYTFAEAAYIATTGRPGPVHIDIPKDVFTEEAEFVWPERGLDPRLRRDPAPRHGARSCAPPRFIDAAERPIIIAGHGVILVEGLGGAASRSRRRPASRC